MSEYERGKAVALNNAKSKGLDELEAEWERRQMGDDYDRGYLAGLREAAGRAGVMREFDKEFLDKLEAFKDDEAKRRHTLEAAHKLRAGLRRVARTASNRVDEAVVANQEARGADGSWWEND